MNLEKAQQVMLGVVFLGAGGQKLAGTDGMVDVFAHFRYPQWFRVATGAIEVTAAASMLAGLRRPGLVPVGGALIGATMVGAVASHLRAGDPRRAIARPVVLLGLAALVTQRALHAGTAPAFAFPAVPWRREGPGADPAMAGRADPVAA